MPRNIVEPESFRSLADKVLMYLGDPMSGYAQIFYSPDRQMFFELKLRAFNGTDDNHTLVVDDPNLGLEVPAAHQGRRSGPVSG